MLNFIQGIHLIVCLMLLFILLKYYNIIKGFFDSKCMQKCLKSGDDS